MITEKEKVEIKEKVANLFATSSGTEEAKDILSLFCDENDEKNNGVTIDNDDSNSVIISNNADFILKSAKAEAINGPLLHRGNYVNIRQLVFTKREEFFPERKRKINIPIMNVQAIRLNDSLDMRLRNINIDKNNNIVDINVGEIVTPTLVTNFSSDRMSISGLSKKILMATLCFIKEFVYTDFCVYKDSKGETWGKTHVPTLWAKSGDSLVRLSPDPKTGFRWENGCPVGLKTQYAISIEDLQNINRDLIKKKQKHADTKHIWYYAYDAVSTSQQRQGKLMLWETSQSSDPSSDRIRRLNKMASGFIETMAHEYAGEDVEIQRIVKEVSSRVSLPITDSTAGARVNSIAIYPSKLYSTVNEKKVESADGQFFMSKEFAKRNLANNGFIVATNSGSYYQSRDGVIKGLGLVLENVMNFIHNINYINDIEVIDINDKKLVKKIMSELYRKELDMNKVYVFAPNGELGQKDVDIFVDMNALKGPMELGQNPMLIMDSPHMSRDVANTSTQIAGGCMLIKGFKDAFKSIFKENLEADVARLFSKNPATSAFPNGNFDGYVDDAIRQIFPEAVTSDKAMFEVAMRDMVKRYSRKISRISFATIGSYNKGLCDLSSLMGVDFSVLKKNEILVCDDKLANKYKQKTVLMVRHPKLSLKEFVMAKVVTRRNAMARLRNARMAKTITQEQYLVLASWVSSLMTGSIVLPSWDDEITAKLGGSDYDGDGFSLFFDERIVSLYGEMKEGQIPFSSSAMETGKMKLSTDFLEKAYYFSLSTGNMAVGAAVMFAYRMRSILSDIENGHLTQEMLDMMCEHHRGVLKESIAAVKGSEKDIAETFTVKIASYPFFTEEEKNVGSKKLVNNMEVVIDGDNVTTHKKHGWFHWPKGSFVSETILYDSNRNEYVPVISEKLKNGEEINEDVVKEFELNAISSNFWKIGNLRSILIDLDIVMASVVGRILDSAKKGDSVSVPCLWLEKFFKSNFYAPATILGENSLEINIQTGLDKSFVYHSNDAVYQLKKDCVEFFNEFTNSLKKQWGVTFGQTQAAVLLPPQNSWERSLLHYGQHLARLNSISNAVLKKDESNNDKTLNLQDTFKEYQVSFMRNLLLEANEKLLMTDKEIISNSRFIELMKLASSSNKGDRKFVSKFYRNFGSELLSYYNDKYNKEDPLVLQEPVFARNGDVVIRDSICPENNIVEMEFKNGFSVDGKLFTKTKINGDYKIAIIDGKAYVTSSLEEMANAAIAKSLLGNKIVLKVRLRKADEIAFIAQQKNGSVFSEEEVNAAQVLRHYGVDYVDHGAEVLGKLLSTQDRVRVCYNRFGASNPKQNTKSSRLIQDFRLEIEKNGGNNVVVCDLNDEISAKPLHQMLDGAEISIDYIFPVSSKQPAIYLFCTKK